MEQQDKVQKTRLGPLIVALANGLRAFDAPIRYPYLFTKYGGGSSLSDAYRFSGFSSFVVLVEHLIGTLFLLPILVFKKGISYFIHQLSEFKKDDWIFLFLISVGSGLGLFFFLISFTLGNPTVAILIQKSQPLFTLFMAMIVLKERPTKFFYVAIVISALGVGLLIIEEIQAKETLFEIMAVFSSLVAAFLWGSNTVWGRIMTKKVDYWDLTAYRYTGGLFVLLGFNVLASAYTAENLNSLFETYNTFGPSLDIFLSGLFIIIIATIFTGGIIPLSVYYFGLRWSKASVGGLAELAFPVLAIFVNFIFLGWGLTAIQIVGALILIIVISYLSYVNIKEHESVS